MSFTELLPPQGRLFFILLADLSVHLLSFYQRFVSSQRTIDWILGMIWITIWIRCWSQRFAFANFIRGVSRAKNQSMQFGKWPGSRSGSRIRITIIYIGEVSGRLTVPCNHNQSLWSSHSITWQIRRKFPSSFVNERNHKMTQIFVKYILHLCIFRHLKLEIALAIPASNDEK